VDEILDITFLVAEALERLGVSYLIGGSLASSLHGIPRATQDVDIVAALRDRDVSGVVAALHEHFYLDKDVIRDAVARHGSFNVAELARLLEHSREEHEELCRQGAERFKQEGDAFNAREQARKKERLLAQEKARPRPTASVTECMAMLRALRKSRFATRRLE
jgi:hypothetical protein